MNSQVTDSVGAVVNSTTILHLVSATACGGSIGPSAGSFGSTGTIAIGIAVVVIIAAAAVIAYRRFR